MESTNNSSRRWGILALVVGGVLIVAAFFVPSEGLGSTWESVLVNVGAASLIVWPVQFITQKLQQRFEERTDEQQQEVKEWREEQQQEITSLSDRLSDLERFDQAAVQAQEENRRKAHELFKAFLNENAKGKDLWLALNAAIRNRLISGANGLYVEYARGSYLLIRFTISEPFAREDTRSVSLRLYDEQSKAVGELVRLGWNDGVVQVLGRLNTIARRHGDVSTAVPSVIFGGLSEALIAADKYPDARPLLQYFREQWALTPEKITALGHGVSIRHDAPNRAELASHFRRKPWLDNESFDEALEAAGRVRPLTEEQLAYGRR
jgi:gas vesicle protein